MKNIILGKTLKILLLLVSTILIVSLWYLITALLFIYPIGSKVADGISKHSLMTLRLGMDEKEVVSLIGQPFYKEGSDWIYGTPGFLGAGWEITIVIIDNSLKGVFVDLSDLGVYRCDTNNCPMITKDDWLEKLVK